MRGAPVEVRKNPKSTTWYNAHILDVNGESVRVCFEHDVWPTRDVPAYSVRRRPQDGGAALDESAFDPQVDDAVEVLVQASESSPGGWSLGRVKTIKNSFYFIGFASSQRGTQDVIVERSALRPCSSESALEPSSLERKLIPVGEELHDWIRSDDSVGCLSHVQSCAGLLVSACMSSDADDEEPPGVLLVGESRAVVLAERLLMQIHLPNQLQMHRFHQMREDLLRRLSEAQQWHNTRHREVFTVDQSLVGKMIGKKGENINSVRERHHVEINIQEYDSYRESSTVTITGESLDEVRRAREEIELIREKVELKSEQVGWILGKGYQNITEIARKTELNYARFEDSEGCLELCGLKHQVEDARMLIQAHMEYLTVYRSMDEEQQAIQQSLDKLDGAGGGGRGRGRGGKGKGRGDGGESEQTGDRGGGGGKRGGGSGRGRKGGGGGK